MVDVKDDGAVRIGQVFKRGSSDLVAYVAGAKVGQDLGVYAAQELMRARVIHLSFF